jgi:hypothetical protein
MRTDAPWLADSSRFQTQVSDLIQNNILTEFTFGKEGFLIGLFELSERPMEVVNLPSDPRFGTGNDLIDLAYALANLEKDFPGSDWSSAVYLRNAKKCLCTNFDGTDLDKRQLAIRLLTGGVADLDISVTQIHALNRWISKEQIEEFFAILGLEMRSTPRMDTEQRSIAPTQFSLPGRPELEAFFREYILDYVAQSNRYEAMGLKLPSGILLHGPPGSGKTYAVKSLADFVGWPVFDVSISSIGSPYIHETSVRLRRIFEEAADQAPSILLMDDLDAIASDRNMGGQAHKVEEVGELLRLIERAHELGILVFATTNRLDSIDDALLRKGRFDHTIEVSYPTEGEVTAVLTSLLNEKPTVAGISIETAANRLANRPLSDTAWVINEAARLTVKAEKDSIDDFSLMTALKKLPD